MLVLNASSVAVLWFGASRVDAGQIQIGALTAFLSYLMQILMSVMMATFMLIMVPRAAVCAERIVEVLDTDSSVVPPGEPGHGGRDPRRAGVARRAVPVPGRGGAGAAGHLVPRPRRTDDRDHRQHRCRQDDAALADAPALRRHRRDGAGRRRRRPRTRPRTCCGSGSGWCRSGRTCSPARWPATCGTATRTRPTRSCGPAWRSRRRATSSRRCRRGWRRRSRRAARTSPAVSGSGWRSPARWSASRRSTCSTTRSPRSTSAPTPDCGPRCARSPPTPPWSSWPSGCPPSSTPTRSSCSRTARSSASGVTGELLDSCPTYAEIVESQLTAAAVA